ncbi:MAG TPA: hypothetical protein VH255_09920 [Verrucomicrobiae bacterium]|jgi:hypothetical protein|nr:hypothetical protein [Verrucomicrobiae bacterium]
MRIGIAVIIGCTALGLRADQVMLQNGDRYNGKVVSVSTNAIVLQSDVIGTVTLPRAKVASVDFGTAAAAPATPKPQPANRAQTAITNGAAGQLSQLTASTNLIEQVQSQFLGDATPETTAKFRQMLNDLSTGKMSMGDLRKQAADEAEELRSDIKEMGDDSGVLSSYLSTLDDFVNQSGGAVTATNAPAKGASKATSSISQLDSLLDSN